MKQKVKMAQMYGSGPKGGAYTEVDKFSGMMR
jgi:hypothetical protein